MSKQIKAEVKTLIKEMAAWCIDSHTQEFMCDFHFNAHVNWLDIKLMSGGRGNGEVYEADFIYLDKEHSFKWVTKAFKGMKEFKSWHDEEFKPENIAIAQEEAKKKKIKSLKSQLLALEQ